MEDVVKTHKEILKENEALRKTIIVLASWLGCRLTGTAASGPPVSSCSRTSLVEEHFTCKDKMAPLRSFALQRSSQ